MPLPLLLGRVASVRLLLLTLRVSSLLVDSLLDNKSLNIPYEVTEEEYRITGG